MGRGKDPAPGAPGKTKVSIREVKGDELKAEISTLREFVYPYIAPEVRDVEFYYSIYYWFGRHPLADAVRRWVSVTGDGRVVGHLAATPQFYRVGGRRLVAHTPADLMVHPKHGFQTFALLRRFFRECENCVACDMVPGAIRVEKRMGVEDLGQLPYAAKLLNVSRLPTPAVPAPLRRAFGLPEPATAPATYGYPGRDAEAPENHQDPPDHQQELPTRPRVPLPAPAKKLLNAALGAADRALGAAFAPSPRAEPVQGFDPSFDRLFEAVSAAVPCAPEKDAAFLGWRYGPGSPQHPVAVLGVRDGWELLGYVIAWIPLNGYDGYVFDLTTLPGRPDVARALLRGAVRWFRERGVEIIRYRYFPSPTAPRPTDLLRLGFFHRQGRSHTLLTKFKDPAAGRLAHHGANWAYNIGDGEATFWHR